MSYFLLFLAAFDPQVPFLPNGIGFTFLISLILFPFVILKLRTIKMDAAYNGFKKITYFIYLFFLSLFLILIRWLANEGEGIYFILSWAKAFFVFIACLFVFFLFFKNKKSSVFIISLAAVYSSNAAFNYMSGTFPEAFGFLDLFRGAVISDSLGKNPYRDSFVSGSGYFSIGTAYSLIVLLFSFYIVQSKSKSVLLAAAVAFTAIAGFVAARTAFFAIAPALSLIFKSRFLYFGFLAIAGCIAIYFLLDLPALQPYKGWMLSFFLLSENASGSYLIEQMYFWPGDSVFLFGLGAVNDGAFTYTDGGYMQDILFGGVFFLAMKLLFLAVLFFSFFKKYPVFITFVSFAILAFHFKGLFIYNKAQGMASFYFIFLYLSKLDIEMKFNRVGV